MLQRFEAWLVSEQLNPETIRQYLIRLRAVLHHARPKRWPKPKRGCRTADSSSPKADAAENLRQANQHTPGTVLHYLFNVYALEHNIGKSGISQLAWSAAAFGKFLGRDARPADFTSENLNRFLIDSLPRQALATVHSRRRTLLTIWRSLYEAGEISEYPRRIRKLPAQRKLPEAWTVEQVERLLTCVNATSGKFRGFGVPKSEFFRAFMLIGWELGLRLGDILALKFTDVSPDGVVSITQHKTGFPIVCELSPLALTAIEDVKRYGVGHLGEVCKPRKVMHNFQLIVKRAGLKGTAKFLRRSGATAVEIAKPGAATLFLGHRTPDLAMKHYVDPRQLQVNRPKPPQIGGNGNQGNQTGAMNQ